MYIFRGDVFRDQFSTKPNFFEIFATLFTIFEILWVFHCCYGNFFIILWKTILSSLKYILLLSSYYYIKSYVTLKKFFKKCKNELAAKDLKEYITFLFVRHIRCHKTSVEKAFLQKQARYNRFNKSVNKRDTSFFI